MFATGDKAQVDTGWGGVVLVTLGPQLNPDEAKEIGGDGFWVTYETGIREGTTGRHRFHELKAVSS